MCLSSRNLLSGVFSFGQTFVFCSIISSEFCSYVRQDKLFRIDNGCGKTEGDGVEFFFTRFFSLGSSLMGVASHSIAIFHWCLRVEVELSKISLAQLPAIYAVLEHSPVLWSKQGEAACRHSSSPTGIFTHLGFSSLVKSLFYFHRLFSIYNIS